MIDGQKVFAVHRDDDGVPGLRNEDLIETSTALAPDFEADRNEVVTFGLYLTVIRPVAHNLSRCGEFLMTTGRSGVRAQRGGDFC